MLASPTPSTAWQRSTWHLGWANMRNPWGNGWKWENQWESPTEFQQILTSWHWDIDQRVMPCQVSNPVRPWVDIGLERREKIRREKSRRERVRRKKMQMREKVGKSRNTVFFPMIWSSGGSKSRLAKAAGAEPAGQMRDEKVHADVARSTCPSQNVQNTPCSDHFWKLRCWKSARRCGAKHIWKSKCTKHTIVGPLLDIEMSKKCTPLWREAHFEVKSAKNWGVRGTFGRSDVVLHDRRKGLCTLSKVSKKVRGLWHFQTTTTTTPHHTPIHYTTPQLQLQLHLHYIPLHCTPLHPLHSTTPTTLNYTQLHYTTLHYATLHSTTLHYTTLHYRPLHYITLHYTTLQYTTRHYTTLHYITLHYLPLHYTTLHYTTLPSITLHYITLHSTTLQLQPQLHNYTPPHFTTLHYTKLHYTTLHYTTLHSTTLHYTALHYITLHYTTFHYTSLHYTALHSTTLQLHNYTPLHSTTLQYTPLR